MELKCLQAGKVDELLQRFAVYMKFANRWRGQREVIAVCGFDPLQTHTSVDFASFAFAQEIAAVIDVNLRQHFKCVS